MVEKYVRTNSAGGVNAAVERVGDGKRFQEWRLTNTAHLTAIEIAKYFRLKNYVKVTVERYAYLLGTPTWERFFDPFNGSIDGKQIVVRDDWNDAFFVAVNENSDNWQVTPTIVEQCEHNFGWKLAMPLFYAEFKVNRSQNGMLPIDYEQFCQNWLSEGTTYLKEWGPWLWCCENRAEANAWLEIGAQPRDATEWLRGGWGTKEAIKKIQSMREDERLLASQQNNTLSAKIIYGLAIDDFKAPIERDKFSHYRADGIPKKSFATKALAEQAIIHLKSEGNSNEEFNSYQCGDHFHIGHARI